MTNWLNQSVEDFFSIGPHDWNADTRFILHPDVYTKCIKVYGSAWTEAHFVASTNAKMAPKA